MSRDDAVPEDLCTTATCMILLSGAQALAAVVVIEFAVLSILLLVLAILLLASALLGSLLLLLKTYSVLRDLPDWICEVFARAPFIVSRLKRRHRPLPGPPSPFDRLPDELVHLVAEWLHSDLGDAHDLRRFSQTNHRIRRLVLARTWQTMQLASNDGLHTALYWLLRQHGSMIRSLEIRADWKAASFTTAECREVHALFWRSGLSVFIQQPEWRGTFRIVDWVTTYAGKLTSLKIVAVDEERKSDGSPSLLLHEVQVLLFFLTNLQKFDLILQRASSYDIAEDLAKCGSLVRTSLAVHDGRISTLFERSFYRQSSVNVKLFAWCYTRAMLKHLDLRASCEDLASLARLMRILGRSDFALETVRLRITQLFDSGPSLDPRVARAIVPCLKTLELSGNSEPLPLPQVSWPTALQLLLHPPTPLEILAFETDWLDGVHPAITTFHDRQPVKTLKTVRISTSTATSEDPVRAAELTILKQDLGAWSRTSQVDVVFEERA